MPRARKISGMIVLSAAGVLVFSSVPDAMAQKKLSYEQAYAKCKREVDAVYHVGSGDVSGRFLRGGACMKQYGFNLKKGAKF